MKQLLTLNEPISDALIKRTQSSDRIQRIKDSRHPIELRFHKSRESGSWYLVKYVDNKAIWRKVGNWPTISSRALVQNLPDLLIAAFNQPGAVLMDQFANTEQLLDWYLARFEKNRALSIERKTTVRSAIIKHLKSSIGHIELFEISKPKLDQLLIWPLQERYELSYVKSIFSILKQAFKQAASLGMIQSDPVAAFQFSNFIKKQLKIKPGKLRADQIDDLLTRLPSVPMPLQTRIQILLAYGTRIGETRKIKWVDIDWSSHTLILPAQNTKSKREHRLPLSIQMIQILSNYKVWQGVNRIKTVYVFPGTTRGLCVSARDASQSMHLVSDGEWTAHDLRKLARTCWADLGIDYMVGEVLLNHQLSKLDRTYIHTFVEEQTKLAINKYHEYLDKHGFLVFSTTTGPRWMGIDMAAKRTNDYSPE